MWFFHWLKGLFFRDTPRKRVRILLALEDDSLTTPELQKRFGRNSYNVCRAMEREGFISSYRVVRNRTDGERLRRFYKIKDSDTPMWRPRGRG
jgi:hypothetical protein